MDLQKKIWLCPECQKPLMEVISHEIKVSRCNGCRGIFVEPENVNHPHISEFAESDIPKNEILKTEKEENLLCPDDGSEMNRTEHGTHPNLTISVCSLCRRAWFDAKSFSDSIKCQEQTKNTKGSILNWSIAALGLAALFFFGRSILSWLPGHFEAETLKAMCIAAAILGTASLFGLGIANQGASPCGSGGCCVSRAAIAGAAGMLGDNFWKICIIFCFFMSALFFATWTQHPDKAKNPVEVLMNKQSFSYDSRQKDSSRPMTVDDLRYMGEESRNQGKYVEAESLYKRALMLYERLPKKNAHNIAMTLGEMGLLCRDTDRFEEAESFYKRALAIFETLSRENPSGQKPILMVAVVLRDMAALYRVTNRLKEAEKLEQEEKRILDENADELERQGAELQRILSARK